RLVYAHVLHLRELDVTRDLGEHSGFVTQLVSGDRDFDGPPVDVTADGNEQDQHGRNRQPWRLLFGGQILGLHHYRRHHHQHGASVPGLHLLHTRTNDSIVHATALRVSRGPLYGHAC